MHLQYPLIEELISFKSVDIMLSTTRPKLFLLGKNRTQTKFSLIGIKMLANRPLKDIIYYIEKDLDREQLDVEIKKVFPNIHKCMVVPTEGLLGFTKFLQGYYMMYIESSLKIAKIGRHKIRVVKKTGILPLFQLMDDDNKAAQKKYIEMLRSYKLDNFYFSHTYDLTNSLHWNLARNAHGIEIAGHQPKFSQDTSMYGVCEMFQWNYNLLKQFDQAIGMRQWILPVIHGFCRHINIKTRGTPFAVVIVSRRSRHHAGTRYIKRGINKEGFVANFVETQQVVVRSSNLLQPNCSSFTQIRGSAPVYWMQQPSLVNPKPAIQLIRSDSMFLSTKKHFRDLISRYGRQIFCVNLMKTLESSPRQTILSGQYRQAVGLVNLQLQSSQDANRIHYMETDFKANQKINKYVFVGRIKSLAYFCIMNMGVFQCESKLRESVQTVSLQNGIIRANCVDCLDRTNSFQQLVGETALAIQVAKLLDQQIDLSTINKDPGILQDYGATFQEMGDLLSIQYGSSLAHKQQVNKTQTTRFQFLTSVTRHFNNTFTDSERQQQIDVFLKVFDPKDGNVWDFKPNIALFPNQNIRSNPAHDWDKLAFESYIRQSNIQGLNHCVAGSRSKQHKAQLLNRHDLVVLFSNQVADQMYTDYSERFQFLIQLPIKLHAKMWKASNSKHGLKINLQEKLSNVYYRSNRTENSRPPVLQSCLMPQESELGGSVAENSHLFPNLRSPISLRSRPSIKVFQSSPQAFYSKTSLSQDEIQSSVWTYFNEETVNDGMIENDVQMLADTLVDPDTELPVENLATAEEIENISFKIFVNDFISQNDIQDEHHSSPERRERKRTFNAPTRTVRVEEMKAQVLEVVIKRGFSHGCKIGKVRIV